ncbi:MAG: hypothetical protein MI920_18450 [Kiloniellales bacterium]|nr:hypothetical protein [Kiloniellales bacterium]
MVALIDFLTDFRVIIPVTLSLLLPLAVFIGRHNIRIRRNGLLEELKSLLELGDGKGSAGNVQTFAMARARYLRSEADASLVSRLKDAANYFVPVLIFVLVSSIGFVAIAKTVTMEFSSLNFVLAGPVAHPAGALTSYQHGTVVLLATAFAAAYVWSIGYLVLRIANFDLSPLSFLRTSVHILLTCLTAVVLRHALANGFGVEAETGIGFLIAFSLLQGMFPRLGINYLVERMPSAVRLNRPVPKASKISRFYPLDLIDGISSEVKFRLGAFEITDAQNLATQNPVILFLETPYGLFKILDWVSQAQLLLVAGPERYLKLRELNVHNIRELLAYGRHPETRKLLRPILIDAPEGIEVTDEMIRVELESVAEALHVQRLEQLCHTLSRSAAELPAEGQRGKAAADGGTRALLSAVAGGIETRSIAGPAKPAGT